MAINTLLKNFSEDIKNTFQTRKSITDVAAKYLNELSKEEIGTGTIDYSTDEQDTGIKWIDGSKIYQKTALIENISISAGGSTDISLNTYFSNINKLVSAECVYKNGTIILPSIHVNSTLSPYSVGLTISKAENHITFTRGSGSATEISVYITIKYTKAS